MSTPANPGTIFVDDPASRQLLENIARFDAAQEGRGKVNLTRTVYRVLRAEWDRIAATPEGKKFVKQIEKEQGQPGKD
jgi:hypothetical protein